MQPETKQQGFQPLVAAVILTYNRKKMLLEVLEALFGQDCGTPDILIIDNCSTDGTREAIADYIKLENVFYENTGSNLGGAAGFHYGIKKAVLMGYERLWIMDDDCVPEQGALSALMKADAKLKGRFGWLSSLAYWTDGNLCRMNEHYYVWGKRIKDYSKPLTPAINASFVSLYLPRIIVLQMGLNISEFKMWVDDWEYSRRISRKYPCYVVSNSKVIHKMPSNKCNNIALDSEDRIWRYQYAYRNEIYVMFREGMRGKVYWLMRLAYHAVRVLLQSKGNRWKRWKIMFSGTWKGFFFHPQIEYIDPLDQKQG